MLVQDLSITGYLKNLAGRRNKAGTGTPIIYFYEKLSYVIDLLLFIVNANDGCPRLPVVNAKGPGQ